MKLVSLKTMASGIVCALLAASALAQSETQPVTPGTPGQPGHPSMGTSSRMGAGQSQSWRASKQLLNASVKDQKGQELGTIEDLIVNPQSGRCEFAVLSVGGKLHPLPFQLLQPSAAAPTTGTAMTGKLNFTANVERQKIESSPAFERGQWPSFSKDWASQIYSHYGVQQEAVGGTPGQSQEGTSEEGTYQEPGSTTR